MQVSYVLYFVTRSFHDMIDCIGFHDFREKIVRTNADIFLTVLSTRCFSTIRGLAAERLWNHRTFFPS